MHSLWQKGSQRLGMVLATIGMPSPSSAFKGPCKVTIPVGPPRPPTLTSGFFIFLRSTWIHASFQVLFSRPFLWKNPNKTCLNYNISILFLCIVHIQDKLVPSYTKIRQKVCFPVLGLLKAPKTENNNFSWETLRRNHSRCQSLQTNTRLSFPVVN